MLSLIFFVATGLVCCFALALGGRDERGVSLIFLIAAGTSTLVSMLAHDNYAGVQWAMWTVDAAMLVALYFLAVMSSRDWPIWMVAMQFVSVLGHAARLMNPGVSNWIYYVLTGFWAYPMLLLLAVATVRYRRRLRNPNVEIFSPASWLRYTLRNLRPWRDG